ncbi:NUDIX hydrolase [Leptolyngbya sp. FACHB-261]|uniref:NUDIX hydrolase n=1 Tax=Leptolyngbya sp. FACHB-261 TaxID=2692806 RepID=UPI00168516A8|nr:NUDIX domain-containing protein [Leptolyngbya sp. FACHB-261]MBD2103579.1 NUDIX domain-containing protein [Leptolyngbya sp. FACHB-261]
MRIDESWYKRPASIAERTTSGGVIVRIESGKIYIALVREVGLYHYVLPKGGVEAGETLEQAAWREIQEEAGLTELQLISKLDVRERLDYRKRRWITAHYFLFLTEQVDGVPTDPKHHYKLAWAPLDTMPKLFWPEQQDLIQKNRDKIMALLQPQSP